MDDKIVNYIETKLLVGEESLEITSDDDLLGSGLVDSLGMMKLIRFIEKEFELKIPAEDMVIENFMTVSCITTYLKSRA